MSSTPRERGGGPEVGQRAVDVVHRAEELRRDVNRDAVEAEGAGVLEHLAPEAAQRAIGHAAQRGMSFPSDRAHQLGAMSR